MHMSSLNHQGVYRTWAHLTFAVGMELSDHNSGAGNNEYITKRCLVLKQRVCRVMNLSLYIRHIKLIVKIIHYVYGIHVVRR